MRQVAFSRLACEIRIYYEPKFEMLPDEMIKCLPLKYGESLTRNGTPKNRKDEKLCFTKTVIFELCKNI